MNDIEELDAVRQLNPTTQPSAGARVAAADRLQQRIDRTHGHRSRRRPIVLAGAATALAVAGLVAVSVIGGGSDSRLVAPADAAQALGRVADVAADRPDATLQPGEYWYVQDASRYLTTVGDSPPYSALGSTELRETWTDRDGNGRYRSTSTGQPEFLGPRDRQRWKRSGSPQLSGRGPGQIETQAIRSSGFTAGASTLTYEQLSDLPTEGNKMYSELRRLAGDSGPSPDEEVFTIIGDLLRNDPVPPRVRAALYRAVAYIKGIRLVGPVKDSLNRPGVAVELDSSGMHRRLVFDPDTALLLAEQDVLAERVSYIDADPGTIVGDRLAVRQTIVSSDDARP
ncbi:MAG: hypothetical protein JWO02_1306 [Solirubrobacterales bacterium]|nr:hypothetical protein [Solirubrobacterales bacterium]